MGRWISRFPDLHSRKPRPCSEDGGREKPAVAWSFGWWRTQLELQRAIDIRCGIRRKAVLAHYAVPEGHRPLFAENVIKQYEMNDRRRRRVPDQAGRRGEPRGGAAEAVAEQAGEGGGGGGAGDRRDRVRPWSSREVRRVRERRRCRGLAARWARHGGVRREHGERAAREAGDDEDVLEVGNN